MSDRSNDTPSDILGFIPLSGHLWVLLKHFEKLYSELAVYGQSGNLAIKLSGKDLVSEATLNIMLSSSRLDVKSYHLLNEIRSVVANDVNRFHEFIKALELYCPSLREVAKEMADDYDRRASIIPQSVWASNDDISVIHTTNIEKFEEVLSVFTKEIIENDMSVDALKDQLITLCFAEEVTFSCKEDGCQYIGNLCTSFNYDVLLHFVDKFNLTKTLLSLRMFENNQQYYTMKLISTAYVGEIEQRVINSVDYVYITLVLHNTNLTVAMFKYTIRYIFSELSRFIHVVQVDINDSIITLCAPMRTKETLVIIANKKLECARNVFKFLTIGQDVIVTGIKVPCCEGSRSLTYNSVNCEGTREIKNYNVNYSSENDQSPKNRSINASSAIINQETSKRIIKSVRDDQGRDINISDQDCIIGPRRDHEQKEDTLVPHIILPICCTQYASNSQEGKKRLRFPPERREVIIIGSFEAAVQQSNIHVAQKIVPRHLESEQWIKDEIEKVKDIYDKFPDTFDVSGIYTGTSKTGNPMNAREYLEIIKYLFKNSKEPGISIWYTGHAERNTGNWVCKGGGVIAFQDIYELYMKYLKGKSLTIISDCSYSGNWIIECAKKLDENEIPSCGHKTREKGMLVKIVSSCQASEEANVLSFITEGVHYDDEDKGVINCPHGRQLRSGQTPMCIDFRDIVCSKPVGQGHLCQVDCKWEYHVTSGKTRTIIHGKSEGQDIWHILLLSQDKLDELKCRIDDANIIDLSVYGQIIDSGWGNTY